MKHKTDIIIAGGGMIGLSLAIGLAQSGMNVLVIEKDSHNDQVKPEFDGRVSAISLGSLRVLEAIGAWRHMQDEAQPILDIRVVEGFSNAFVHYHYQDAGDKPMGYMVQNRYTRLGLLKRASELKTLTILSPALITQMECDDYTAKVTLSDKSVWQAPLLVAADGRHSGLREQMGIKTVTKHYTQSAIVCTVEHSIDHEGLAMQRFTPTGPFAALPMKGGHTTAIVWSEDSATVPGLLAASEAEFNETIARMLGDYLGTIKTMGKKFAYPLTMILAKSYIAKRFALIGDSAHGIHPVAGQGVNVGFRDVAVMVELITQAMKSGQDIGSQHLLEHYQRWRRFDGFSTGAIMDGIVNLFSNDYQVLRLARQTGLNIVNHTPPLKRFFMKQAMGLMGDLPPMMQEAS